MASQGEARLGRQGATRRGKSGSDAATQASYDEARPGRSRRGRVRHGRRGMSGSASVSCARFGQARQVWCGGARCGSTRQDWVQHDMARQARLGPNMASRGKAGTARRGIVRLVSPGHGPVRQASQGRLCHGRGKNLARQRRQDATGLGGTRQDVATQASHGKFAQGVATQARCVPVCLGLASQGKAGIASPGLIRRGAAGRDGATPAALDAVRCDAVRQRRRGMTWQG
jgi:hypothetical protein